MITLAEDMKIGVELIDIQHQELIDRLNSVANIGIESISKEETQKTLNFLSEYVLQHFRDEEELQRLFKYPKYEEHRKLHQDYIREFSIIKQEFEANGYSSELTIDLVKSIMTWVIRHIRVDDMEFGAYYKTKKL
jgi:hemerythrin